MIQKGLFRRHGFGFNDISGFGHLCNGGNDFIGLLGIVRPMHKNAFLFRLRFELPEKRIDVCNRVIFAFGHRLNETVLIKPCKSLLSCSTIGYGEIFHGFSQKGIVQCGPHVPDDNLSYYCVWSSSPLISSM